MWFNWRQTNIHNMELEKTWQKWVDTNTWTYWYEVCYQPLPNHYLLCDVVIIIDFHMLGRDAIVHCTLQEINNREIFFLNFGLWHDDYFTTRTHTNISDFSHRSGLCQLEHIGWKSAAIQKFSDTLTHETCQFQPKTDLFAIAYLWLVYAHLCIL